jgi:hypothetical protein
VTKRSWENCPEEDREAARLDRLEEMAGVSGSEEAGEP